MNIPKSWSKARAECTSPENLRLSLAVWGWGREEEDAKREASARLDRLLERVRRGGRFPDTYGYGARPLREEILQSFDGDSEDQPKAVLTRNRYGSLVLNTPNLLFLDVDLPPITFAQRVRRLFSSSLPPADETALERLRDALRQYGRATFRLYRTAAGFRAIAIDREFDPAGRDTQDLMKATGTDPAFSRLCLVQKSFRARLTPKPWRCKCPRPPGEHPRTEDAVRHQFAAWLDKYESASKNYATCRYVETIGPSDLKGEAELVVGLHDRTTRCDSSLPLA